MFLLLEYVQRTSVMLLLMMLMRASVRRAKKECRNAQHRDNKMDVDAS
jgi:hypothetical protein